LIDRPTNYKPICRIPDNNQGVFALVSCHDPALVETNASAGNIICLKSEKPNIHKRNGVKGKSWFQSAGPIIVKACVLAIEVLARSSERSGRRQMAEEGSWIRSCKYLGA